jgi:prophage DNA circulation protein
MADEWATSLFVPSYNGVDLELLSFDDDIGRITTEHNYPNRDGANIDDRGANAKQTRWQIVFAPLKETQHVERFIDFLNVLHDGQPHTLTHPFYGSFDARPSDISVNARGSDSDWILLSVTFTEHTPRPAIFLQVRDSSDAALADVTNVVADLDASLSTAGLSSTVGATSQAQASAWADISHTADEGAGVATTARTINLELNAISNEIDDEISRLELATDIERQPVLQGMRRLRSSMQGAADATIARTPRLIRYTVLATAPLLSIVQEIYGTGVDAEDRVQQILELNQIRDPSRIEARTVLVAQALEQTPRTGVPR